VIASPNSSTQAGLEPDHAIRQSHRIQSSQLLTTQQTALSYFALDVVMGHPKIAYFFTTHNLKKGE